MTKEDRPSKILLMLIEREGYITIREIADELKRSPKTIYNDLLEVDQHLQGKPLELVKVTGQGIKLNGDFRAKVLLRKELQEEDIDANSYSPNSRRTAMAIRLLASGEGSVKVNELAKLMYSSRATIQKDLEKVSDLFQKYHITLVRQKNKPLEIRGKEKDIRSCLLDLLLNQGEIKNLVDLIIDENSFRDEDVIFKDLGLTGSEVKGFLHTFREAQIEFFKELPLQVFVRLLVMTYISLLRFRLGHEIVVTPDLMKSIENEPFFDEVEKISHKIEESYGVSLSLLELKYLQVYYVSQFRRETHSNDHYEARELASRLIKRWEEILGHDLKHDRLLLENLADHLVPALTRFRHGIYLENPILGDIKKIHNNTFSIVEQSRDIIEDTYHTLVSDHELSFLVLHLATGIDRLKKPLNVLLVCHVGLGARILLKERLSAKIPEIKIIKTANYFAAYDENPSNFDLIITTIELKKMGDTPIMEINPLIHPSDLDAIRKMIIPLYNKKNDPYEMDGKEF